MVRFGKASIVALGVIALAACSKTAPPPADTTAVAAAAAPDAAADEQAVRAINPAWFKAFNERNVEGLVSLYADDAILSTPGRAPARGTAAIRDAYTREIRDVTAAGILNNPGPSPEIGVSGDLAHEWSSFTVTDKSGKTIDTGKYVTVFARRNGKWVIIRDIWNSDTPAPAT